jgi:hypothetical protein
MPQKHFLSIMRVASGSQFFLYFSFFGLDFFNKFLTKFLTPKGLNVRMVDKPVLVNVTWAHSFFRFFETFCEHVPRNKLRGKKENAFFGPMDQKLCVFEVSRRSLGRASMCWSQW